VEVFAAYIRMLDEIHPIMPSLKALIDETLMRESWMHKAVGMQIVIEGLALYVFREMRNTTEEPLLKQLLTYVSRDEARHTGYGIKYLSHVMQELGERQVAELEDFAFEASRKLVDSRQGPTMRQSVLRIWQEEGLDPAHALSELLKEREKIDAAQGGAAGPIRGFVIPTLRSIGLFSPRIEAQFREMFAANFGEERTRSFRFDAALPSDLEAWIESTR